MKHIIFAIALTVTALAANAADLTMPIRGVADGDTIRSTLKLPCPLCNVSVRISGIDTPETTHLARCDKERELGLQAKEFVIKLIGNQTTMVARNIKWDKYGGRILANVEVGGVNVGESLIAQGLARPYSGAGPKADWCR